MSQLQQSDLDILEKVVRERARLVDEWRQKNDGLVPPKESVFTAYDLTREAQHKHGMYQRHLAVKDTLHDLIAREFSVTQDEVLVDIPGVTDRGALKPRLYFPPEISPQVAEALFKGDSTGATQVKVIQSKQLPSPTAPLLPPVPGISVVKQPGDDGYQADKRGRLWVPADKLRKIGAAPGDFVYVTVQAPSLRVSKVLPASAQSAAAYKVDPHNNIAVSKSVFEDAGMTGDKYSVTDSATEITISVA